MNSRLVLGRELTQCIKHGKSSGIIILELISTVKRWILRVYALWFVTHFLRAAVMTSPSSNDARDAFGNSFGAFSKRLRIWSQGLEGKLFWKPWFTSSLSQISWRV